MRVAQRPSYYDNLTNDMSRIFPQAVPKVPTGQKVLDLLLAFEPYAYSYPGLWAVSSPD